LNFIEYDNSFSEEEKQLSKALKLSCKLNDAACKLKLKDYKGAKELCTEVIIRRN
jgi:peptidylprolyl isomerase